MNTKLAGIVRSGRIPTAADAGLGAKFVNAVKKRDEYKALIKAAEDKLGDKSKGVYGLNQEIEDMLVGVDLTVVTCGDRTVTRKNGTNVSIHRETLQQAMLEYGIDPEDVNTLLEAATNRKEYTYIEITDTKVLTERAEKGGFEVKSESIKKKAAQAKMKRKAARA